MQQGPTTGKPILAEPSKHNSLHRPDEWQCKQQHLFLEWLPFSAGCPQHQAHRAIHQLTLTVVPGLAADHFVSQASKKTAFPASPHNLVSAAAGARGAGALGIDGAVTGRGAWTGGSLTADGAHGLLGNRLPAPHGGHACTRSTQRAFKIPGAIRDNCYND